MSQDEAQGAKPAEEAVPDAGVPSDVRVAKAPEQPGPAAAAEAPSPDIDSRAKRPRPVLGPALTLFAVLLWAFVVIGTFTTSWLSGGAPLAEGLALALVALASAGAWVHAVLRSRAVPVQGLRGLIRRSAAVGGLAFGMWGLVVILAMIAGKASSANIDAYLTACLLAVVAMAAFAGHRLTLPAKQERTRALRVGVVALWIGVAAVTLGACAEIVGEG